MPERIELEIKFCSDVKEEDWRITQWSVCHISEDYIEDFENSLTEIEEQLEVLQVSLLDSLKSISIIEFC